MANGHDVDPTMDIDPNPDFTLPIEDPSIRWTPRRIEEVTALSVIWASDDSDVIGEVLLFEPGAPPSERGWIFGRSPAHQAADGPSCRLVRQRPGENLAGSPLINRHVSRHHLRIAVEKDGALLVTNLSRTCPLLLNGVKVTTCRASPGDGTRCGDILELKGQMMFLCVRRPTLLPAWPKDLSMPADARFGDADYVPKSADEAGGLVGESPAVWALRLNVRLVALMKGHVLVTGASGSGKELLAQALHRLSSRGDKKLITCSAPTLGKGNAAEDLFGVERGFLGPRHPGSIGLVEAATGSSLYFDEIGDMPTEHQSLLLRVLDSGEYRKVGATKPSRADFRLIGATNQELERLRPELTARFPLGLEVPPLTARREDIPLLIKHLFRSIVADVPALERHFRYRKTHRHFPPISAPFIYHAVRRDYPLNTRDLYRLLAQSTRVGLERGHPKVEWDQPEDPGSAPAQALPEPPFDADDRALIYALRASDFQVLRCCRSGGTALSPARVYDKLKVLFCKALTAGHAGETIDIEGAAVLLAGSRQDGLRDTLARQLEKMVAEWRRSSSQGGLADLQRKTGKRFRGDMVWITPVLELLGNDGPVAEGEPHAT